MNPTINLLIPTSTTDARQRIQFNTLQRGDRYTHNINVHTALKRTEDSITIRRHDDWLCTINIGEFGWDKEVVKV